MDQPERIASGAGELTVAPATPDDVDTIVRLDEESAAWARARGHEPGEPPIPLREIVERRVARGEAYLAWLDATPVGTLTLQWADAPVWGGNDTGDALYVHGLMTSRAHAGRDIGLALLHWAGQVAEDAGKNWLRLDCRADNPALRAYYERAGFVYRGDVRLLNYHGARYERRAGGDRGPEGPADGTDRERSGGALTPGDRTPVVHDRGGQSHDDGTEGA
jgi:GNAT superfamily N-acetyltransferase